MPAQTAAITPGVIVGTAFTVMLIGCALLVPQLFVTVIRPLYVPGAVPAPTGIGIVAGNADSVTFVRPAGDPVHAMLYVSAGPVEVYERLDAVPAHTVAILPGVIAGTAFTVTHTGTPVPVPQPLPAAIVPQ